MNEKLVYIGKILSLEPIPDADNIVSATVVCGSGGKWRGVVQKDAFQVEDLCIVFLPDAMIPEREDMAFMKHTGWRVKMRKFRGAASEVVIMPYEPMSLASIGNDVTEAYGVKKYYKPVPPNLQGIVKGDFPGFIPKTDEPNYQSCPEIVEKLVGNPYYITEKADGSSTTVFKYKASFGVCSRNWELKEDEANGYWRVVNKYNLKEKLPEGYAIQFETCGPKVQKNPMGLQELDGFFFSVYLIPEKRLLYFEELTTFRDLIGMPMVNILDHGECFSHRNLNSLAEGTYINGKPREGIVIRSKDSKISFKVINLNYET